MSLTTSEIIAKLNLIPNSEGGFFVQTFKDTSVNLTTSQLPPRYVWFGAFPTRDFDIVMDNKLVKKAQWDAEKHFSLEGTTVAPAFEVDDFVLAKCSKLISRFPALKSLISMLTGSD